MARLSANVNNQQPSTLPSNTIQNIKNNGHCMEITTRGGKQTIDSPMPSNEKKMTKYNDKVIEVNGKVEDNIEKDVDMLIKVIPMPKPPPPFPNRLEKKVEDGKYRCFITMLK